jgi:hypothetical protein
MNFLNENDLVRLVAPLRGKNIINHDEVMIEANERGTVVLIYGSPEEPSAYEVEFYYPEQNICVLMTVKPEQVLRDTP